MSEARPYPEDKEVRVEWKSLQIAIVVLSVVVIWPLFYFFSDLTKNLSNKLLLVSGLNIDIIGVVVASLKTPFYGIFYDEGRIEITRATVENRYFQRGMLLIGLGVVLQALGTIL